MTREELNGIIETVRVERVGGLDPDDLIALHALALKGLEAHAPEGDAQDAELLKDGWRFRWLMEYGHGTVIRRDKDLRAEIDSQTPPQGSPIPQRGLPTEGK